MPEEESAPLVAPGLPDGAPFIDASRFSAWRRWSDRAALDRLALPGIYALAISEAEPGLAVRPFSWLEEIHCLGMTNAALSKRLRQFDNAINARPGHGGGERFLNDFRALGTLQPKLFVSVLPFECDVRSISPKDLLAMGDVLQAEFDCFAEYSRRHGRLPKYNDKARAPKLRWNAWAAAVAPSPAA